MTLPSLLRQFCAIKRGSNKISQARVVTASGAAGRGAEFPIQIDLVFRLDLATVFTVDPFPMIAQSDFERKSRERADDVGDASDVSRDQHDLTASIPVSSYSHHV